MALWQWLSSRIIFLLWCMFSCCKGYPHLAGPEMRIEPGFKLLEFIFGHCRNSNTKGYFIGQYRKTTDLKVTSAKEGLWPVCSFFDIGNSISTPSYVIQTCVPIHHIGSQIWIETPVPNLIIITIKHYLLFPNHFDPLVFMYLWLASPHPTLQPAWVTESSPLR